MNNQLLILIAVIAGTTPALAQMQSTSTPIQEQIVLGDTAKQVQKLGDTKKIFVASLGTVLGAELIRQKIINRLINSSAIKVVDSSIEADAILNGAAELDPGYSNPGYSANLVVHLTGVNKQVLWTDEATFASHGILNSSPNRASSDVADKIVKELTGAIDADKNK